MICKAVNVNSKKIFSWLCRLALLVWVGYWFAAIFLLDLGASPALTLNHELGQIALVLLTVNLCGGAMITTKMGPRSMLVFIQNERRFWGILSFLVLLAHVAFYFINESFEPKSWTQIYTTWYLIFGSASFFILFILFLTSNDLSIKKLKPKRWKLLHRSVYIVQILLFGHILLIEKADLKKYSLWLGLLVVVQVLRLAIRRWHSAKSNF